MADHQITAADLERWVSEGLITGDQRRALLRDLEAHQPIESALTVTNLLYYGGGLLVLLAYSIFLGFQWEGLAGGGRVVISSLSFAFFAAASTILSRIERFRLPGELLQVVTIAIVPLLAFAVLDATGLWPDDPGYNVTAAQQRQYQVDLAWARLAMGAVTLLAAGGAFYLSRSPFVLTAVAAAIASLVIDFTFLVDRDRTYYEWQTPQAVVVALLGAGVFAGGAALRGRTERNYSVLLYLLGLAGLALGLSMKVFEYESAPGWGVLWMIVAFAVVALSVPLQERLLAALGLLGVFTYLARLVFEVFDSAAASLVLVAIGLLVLGAGVVYQRYSARLFPAEGRRIT
ncbi:MAG: DUF2157 domain-containing protein [Dehalococcoidia bacterium]